jgi:RNA polymerase sigma-70 factor (ECF subfamily)
MDDAPAARTPSPRGQDGPGVREAIRAFQSGADREKSFQLLVERFYGPVLGFLSRWIPSEQDRLDVAQEVFLRVYKNLHGYRGEAQFGTWVFRIAYTTYLHWVGRTPLARSGEEPRLLPIDEIDKDALAAVDDPLLRDQLAELIAREESQLLRETIASLPRQMRRCVELYVYQELRYHEIATVLRLSIGTVKAHLFHARERLRDCLCGAPR